MNNDIRDTAETHLNEASVIADQMDEEVGGLLGFGSVGPTSVSGGYPSARSSVTGRRSPFDYGMWRNGT